MNLSILKQLIFVFSIFYHFPKIYSTEIIKFIDNNYLKYFENKEFFDNIDSINSNVLILKMDKKEEIKDLTKTEYFQNDDNFDNNFTNKYKFEIKINKNDENLDYKFYKYNLIEKTFEEDKTFKIEKKWVLVELIDNNNVSEYYFFNDVETKEIKTPEKTIYLTPLQYLNIKKLKIVSSNLEDVSRIDFLFTNPSEQIDITNLKNTNKIKNMKDLFSYCSNLKNIIGLENLKTDSCENMSNMFFFCSNLKNINVSNFNTEKVINMINMFELTGIEEIDISNFKTKNCKHFDNFLSNCKNLKKIIGLENLDFTNTITYSSMFEILYVESKLEELNLSNIKFNKYDKNKYYTHLLPRKIKKIILPKQCFPNDLNVKEDFVNNSKIEEVECDGKTIKLEEYDDLRQFTNDPKTYIDKTRNELKTKYEHELNKNKNINQIPKIDNDNLKGNTCCSIFVKCCCCCKN